MNDHLTELGHRKELIQQEIVRISRHPARVHGLSEDERTSRLLELNDELQLIQQEIDRAAQAEQARNLAMAGLGARPVDDDAKGELDKARAELEKVTAGATDTIRGYAKKVHAAQVRFCDAANAAGQRVNRAERFNAEAHRLAMVVEHGVRFGN